MKKTLALLISLLLLFSVVSTAAFAYDGSQNEYPVILVEGARNTSIYAADGRQIYDFDIDKDKLMDDVKKGLSVFPKAVITNNYDEWVDVVYNAIAPYFEELILDENGEISNGSYYHFEYDKTNPNRNCGNGYDYLFQYDWRLDPITLSSQLEEYINAILASTNTEKVCLVGRCYGSNIVNAYLYTYGIEKIDTVVYYCSLADGCTTSNSCFAGTFEVSPKVLEAYLEENKLVDDPLITELIRATVSFLNSFYGLEPTAKMVELLAKKYFPMLAPRILSASFGGYPSFWAMVSDENYDAAKKAVFGSQEEKYKGFIEKIDKYHEIQIHDKEMLTSMAEEGLNIGVVSKYNKPLVGITKGGKDLGDDTVETKNSSMGATCAPYGEVLSEKYLKNADMNYVSPDRQIDASTCLFKDNTWFIKDIGHKDFPQSIDNLIHAICNFDGQMTVKDNENYPQFLQYDSVSQSLSPVKDNGSTEKQLGIKHFFDSFKRFCNALSALLNKEEENVQA